MSHYPPPPPQPDHHHYNTLYSTSGGAQQLLDPIQHEQLQFSNIDQPNYSKAETASQNHSPPTRHMQSLAEELQHQANIDEQQHRNIQTPIHQIHQRDPSDPANNSAALSQSQPQATTQDQSQKANRLRKACDSCSIRKVKCDESGPPCKACAALEIPCTFDRPSRRRGPPNRHAEAIKRRRLEEAGGLESPVLSGATSPSSPTHAAQALAALSSQSSVPLSAESICPIETLSLLIDEFFTYIHPLCPFPHEPSFREAWKRREDLSNRSFLALLSSMIAALVASFPRKPRLHLKAQKRESMFPNHMSLVHRCQKVCAGARGPGYLENDNLNVYDAATSYFLALTGMYTFRWRQGRLYFGECLTILRTLGLHKAQQHNYPQLGAFASSLGSHESFGDGPQEQMVDNITREMGRRIFWTMFVSVKAMSQLGANFGELVIPPPTHTEPYPPLPVELDDFLIFPARLEPQPPGLVPMIAGFNANVSIYSCYNALTTMEMAWGIDAIVDWDRQKRVLHEALQRCKNSLNELPFELKVSPTHNPFSRSHPQSNGTAIHNNQYNHRDPARSIMSPSSQVNTEQTPEERRTMQYEIQKANIYASSLATRSYLVQKYWNLVEAHSRARTQTSSSLPSSPGIGVTAAGIDRIMAQPPTSDFDMIEQEMRDERESIVKDLLIVLGSIDQVNMEPNADSFTMKIRSIAGTLLEAPDHHKGQLAMQAQEYLSAFLKILMKLERVSPANSDAEQREDEDAELRTWADLREYQMKFAQQGGLLGLS